MPFGHQPHHPRNHPAPSRERENTMNHTDPPSLLHVRCDCGGYEEMAADPADDWTASVHRINCPNCPEVEE